MQHIYIDESGSMTREHTDRWPFFTIAMIVSPNKERAKRVVKRFIAKHLETLRNCDASHKMFNGNTFRELKGSCMNDALQAEFINFMCRNECIKVYLIKVTNEQIRYGLYANTARAFNYILEQALFNLLRQGLLPKDAYTLHIDERNQKTGTTHSLEDYLNIKLSMDLELTNEITVTYYDSAQNSLVQVADVFSNAYYKYCMHADGTEQVRNAMEAKSQEGYFPAVYHFPEKIIRIT